MAHTLVGTAPGPREDLARTLREIYTLGLTTTSGGNLSTRDEAGRIWITPAGTDKGELRPDQVVCIDGADSSARLPSPSSELPFHESLYRARPDLRAIVHAHPISLVAFSVAEQVPDTRVSSHCHALCGDVGFAPYALPGSRALGERIAETFAKGFDCVVLENHGVVVGGTTLRQAFERLEALDLCARSLLRARILGEERLLSGDDLALVISRSSTVAALDSTWDPDREDTLGQRICAMTRRAHARRLMTSTQGVLSARLSEHAFLLTPGSIPLDRLEVSDLLRIDLESSDQHQGDSRAALHAAIYRVHPKVGAVAQGCAEHTAGFSMTGIPLPSQTIPESYILVREPVAVSFRATILEPESVAAAVGQVHPVAVVQNDGALTLGSNILEAFDRLEVLEATAAAVIASRPLGGLVPMNEEQLRELRDAFFPDDGFHTP